MGLLGFKNIWLSFPSLEINKYFLIFNKAKYFFYVIDPLLTKLVRLRWIDIDYVLFSAFLRPKQNNCKSDWCWYSRHKGGCLSCFSIRPRSLMISTLVENRTPSDITRLKSQEKCLIQLGEQRFV